MGTKKGYLILLLLISLTSIINAQKSSDFRSVDSLTFMYYNSGDWGRLIDTGKKALNEGINYKFLRQRLGYAYFAREDYFDAGHQFEKSLKFDSYNEFTLKYLYYSYLYTGREKYAGVFINQVE